MRKKIALFSLLLSTHVWGEEPSTFQHSFTLGIESMRYFYKEPNVFQDRYVPRYGAAWMTDTGNLYGLNGSYRLTWKDILFIQPEMRIVKGTHDYRTGRKEKVNGKVKNEISVLLYEPRLIVGGHIPMMNKITVSPYTGIGYRFKSDDSEEAKYVDLRPNVRRSPNDILGFYRKSNYVYIPFGAYVDYVINDTWSASLKGEYDWMINGWHYSRRLDNGAKTFKQPNGYGLKGEASISYLYKKVRFSVSPYLNYWNIRNSKRSPSGAREPYNITWESGLRLGVSF